MQTCDRDNLLGPYHDGELGPEDRARVEKHLTGCIECANRLAELRGISELISGAETGALSGIELARMHQAVGAADRANHAGGRMIQAAIPLAALAASVLIIASAWLVNGLPSRPQAVPASTVVAAADWETVAMTLQADPRPDMDLNGTALADARLPEWMVESLGGTQRMEVAP